MPRRWPSGRVASCARKRAQLVPALQGQLRPHQSCVLAEWLTQIATLEETIARCDAQIQAACAAAADEAVVVAVLDTIPGVSTPTAQILVAELGTDRQRFPGAAAWAAGAGLAPGNNARAGQPRSGRTRKGTTWRRAVLVPAAQAAAHTQHTALAARYRRIAARRGATRAVIARAHTILVIASHLIARREPSQERGEDDLQHGDPERRTQR